MTDPIASWSDRFMRELPDTLRDIRADAMWRTMAPNGLDLLIGEQTADFGALRGAMSMTIPDEWAIVADVLEGLLTREPLRSGGRWSGQRILIGTLVNELRGYVASAERHAT